MKVTGPQVLWADWLAAQSVPVLVVRSALWMACWEFPIAAIVAADTTIATGTSAATGDFVAVIPGRCKASSPEFRDSGFGPSDHPGMTVYLSLPAAVSSSAGNRS